MIAIPTGVHVWIAAGHTDMRKGFDGLAVHVQEVLKRNPHSGHLFVFRGKRGDLIKVLWHDGQGLCLYAKRLEKGKFIWPKASGDDHARTARLLARRYRLADAATQFSASSCRLNKRSGLEKRMHL